MSPDTWPLAEDVPAWWAAAHSWDALTDEQRDEMADEYAREQIADAQSMEIPK